jgi:hypothetical protein
LGIVCPAVFWGFFPWPLEVSTTDKCSAIMWRIHCRYLSSLSSWHSLFQTGTPVFASITRLYRTSRWLWVFPPSTATGTWICHTLGELGATLVFPFQHPMKPIV